MNIKILKLNVIIFPMDIHSSNSAFRDYVLNYPCAPCRRFKLPFKVPVSYHSWTRMEPSPVRPRRQKDYAVPTPSTGICTCIFSIQRALTLCLFFRPLTASSLCQPGIDCTTSTSSLTRLRDSPPSSSFLLLPRQKTRDYSLRTVLSFIHAWKSSPPPFAFFVTGTRFIFPSRLFLDSWALFPALCRRVDEKIFARKRSRNALLKDVKAFWNETL